MKHFNKIIISIVLIFLIILGNVFHYFYTQSQNEKLVETCSQKNEIFIDTINSKDKTVGVVNDPNSCYCRMYTRLLPRLLVYNVKHNNKELNFIRPSRKATIIPTIILENADAFINYGIGDNADIEYVITELYKKNLYSFSCGDKRIETPNKYIIFGNECIVTDEYIKKIGQKSSGKIHSFKEKLKELNLENKKVFLKIDILGHELEVMPEIIKHRNNLTGISLDIMLNDSNEIIKYEKLLKDIEKNFILVARNEGPVIKHCNCSYKKNHMSPVLSLTYINKEYADKKHIPFKQSYNKRSDYKQLYSPGFSLSEFNMDWKLILSEKITSIFGEI